MINQKVYQVTVFSKEANREVYGLIAYDLEEAKIAAEAWCHANSRKLENVRLIGELI